MREEKNNRFRSCTMLRARSRCQNHFNPKIPSSSARDPRVTFLTASPLNKGKNPFQAFFCGNRIIPLQPKSQELRERTRGEKRRKILELILESCRLTNPVRFKMEKTRTSKNARIRSLQGLIQISRIIVSPTCKCCSTFILYLRFLFISRSYQIN